MKTSNSELDALFLKPTSEPFVLVPSETWNKLLEILKNHKLEIENIKYQMRKSA